MKSVSGLVSSARHLALPGKTYSRSLRRNAGFFSCGLLAWLALAGSASVRADSTRAAGSLVYYVSLTGSDSNPGSVERPWRTIQHATVRVRPGTTVHVGAGTYYGSIVTAVSGNSRAPIRFVSDARWAAHVVGAPGEAVWLNKGDYVDIVGFDITGPNPNGIENLGSYVRILSNHVHNIVAACDENGGSGVNNANYQAHDNDIIGNFVHDVRAVPSCGKRHGIGIYHSNLRGHIFNNISVRNGSVGIQLWHAANAVVVANNTVAENTGCGIVIGAGDAPGGITNDDTEVLNNIAVNNGYFGIQEFGNTGLHNQYVNNLVYNNASGNLSLLAGKASGTIVADAQFVNPKGILSSDYRPGENSPALGAGVSQHAPAVDFQGKARADHRAAVDIGAFETRAVRGKWRGTQEYRVVARGAKPITQQSETGPRPRP